MSKAQTAVKRLFVGRPMSSGELEHTLLPKVIALPIFSSDALSSVAYATQEILLVLGLVGVSALGHVVPISVAVGSLLAIVVISYRQTVRAYPNGGGAYIVAHENLGVFPGLLAAASLLIDYVLTVSVSVVAGVDAIVSASPNLHRFDVAICVVFVAFVALANLRGVRESGIFFAIPTYGFILSMYLLILTGFIKCLDGCPTAESAHLSLAPEVGALSVFILLKAFAAGTTALTGVEAISNGVPAFRYPQSKNAAATLAILGSISISMFLGISWLSHLMNVRYLDEGQYLAMTGHAEKSVIAQIAYGVFHGGPIFYFIQVMTAGILVLAANTAFADFPRLSSILARDRFMPRQFMNRGDRLVFSNGIIILATLASILIVVFKANLNHLIQLYLVGVFISFTLSQSGMVVHWRRTKERGWRRSAIINGFGGVMTAVVLTVVVITKFSGGAWIVVCAIPILILMMRSINRHYESVSQELAEPEGRPTDRRPGNQHLVIVVPDVNAAVSRAVGYARSIRSADVSAIAFDPVYSAPWRRLAPEIPLRMQSDHRSEVKKVLDFVHEKRTELPEDDFLSVIIPEILESSHLFEIFRHPSTYRLKTTLLSERGVQVIDVPLLRDAIDPDIDQAHEPARNYAFVLVSGVHNATLQALEYAETLRPTDLRAVNFGLDPEGTHRLGDDWLRHRIPHPLEIEDSPFRDIGLSLMQYLRQFHADGIDRVVTVVLPEFIVGHRRHQILHNQTALLVKRRLLFEPGVVTVSVPYHLRSN
ncbi:MAG: APC family permease [Actinomycetota bacterium]|nr:APC family permease [Actinomycetota bacterium]